MNEDFNDEQKRFLSEADWSGVVVQLFSLLPDFAFFIKDLHGRFVMVNRRSCELSLVASEAEVLGKTDFDFWDTNRAEFYQKSDRQVIVTGIPIINQIDFAPDLPGSDRLIIFSKIPVKNSQGKIIGVAGVHKEIEEKESALFRNGKMGVAVKMMRENYSDQIDFKQLAKIAGMSNNHFIRRFKELFGVLPSKYLVRIRIQAACRMLEQSNETVSSIAIHSGFYDHSHFSRVFSEVMGMSPSAYRKAHEGRRAL